MVSRSSALLLLGSLGFGPSILGWLGLKDSYTRLMVLCTALVSLLGFYTSRRVIDWLRPRLERRGLFGKDLNKKGSEAGEKPIPEGLGLATACALILCTVLLHFLHINRDGLFAAMQAWGVKVDVAIGREWDDDFAAAMMAILAAAFVGFADDVLDLPWSVKLKLPLLPAVVLCLAYHGGTHIIIPKPLQAAFSLGPVLQLGILYHVYMVLLVVFSMHSINILAGVNGLEAGQTFVIACAILMHNLNQLSMLSDVELRAGHLFSIFVILPLAAVTLGLLTFNWYPSQVFVGDTFTYFAGMTIAVAGILGHFSETLLVFMIPQIVNFLISVPQLFGWVPCPRHRLPTFDVASGLLHPTPNYNLVNQFLYLFGPCTEQWLCVRLLIFQAVSCAAAFGMRHLLEGRYK